MTSKSIQEECTEAAKKVTDALLNTFVLPQLIVPTVETWLNQRITLVMLNQHLRQKPREEECYAAGYDQGYADASLCKMKDNSIKHE